VLQQFYSKEKDTTGDVFVLWRIKKLAAEKGWEIRGDISKGSKDFELKNPLLPAGKKKADAEAEAS
jgi:hypothetical protein